MEKKHMVRIITTDSGLPLFLQVKENILEMLKTMNLKSGDKIPSENDFRNKSNVSIRTIRRALEELERDGVIIRRQGRGSFLLDINAKEEATTAGTIGVLFSDMNYVVRPVFSRLLHTTCLKLACFLSKNDVVSTLKPASEYAAHKAFHTTAFEA